MLLSEPPEALFDLSRRPATLTERLREGTPAYAWGLLTQKLVPKVRQTLTGARRRGLARSLLHYNNARFFVYASISINVLELTRSWSFGSKFFAPHGCVSVSHSAKMYAGRRLSFFFFAALYSFDCLSMSSLIL